MVSIVSNSLPVTVIIPCYRCIATIERAVKSVFNQTQAPKQVILIDDYSDDDLTTIKFLKKIKKKYPKLNIQILALKNNQGPGTARNEGWKKANQPFIAFLDADDSWHPNKLELQYSWMKSHPEILLTAHRSFRSSVASYQKKLNHSKNFYPLSFFRLLFFNSIPTRSVMLRRDIQYRFISGKRYAEDYLLWLTIMLDKHPIYFLNLPLSYSYKNAFGDGGLTGELSKVHAGEVETYQRLLKGQKILWTTYIALVAFSNIKYLRRLLSIRYLKLLNAIRGCS